MDFAYVMRVRMCILNQLYKQTLTPGKGDFHENSMHNLSKLCLG